MIPWCDTPLELLSKERLIGLLLEYGSCQLGFRVSRVYRA